MPKRIEHSPEAVGPLKKGHVRVLQHMLNYRLGKASVMKPRPNGYIMAEIAALSAAIATLNEMLLDEKETQT